MAKPLQALPVKSVEADFRMGYGEHPYLTWSRDPPVARLAWWSRDGGAARVTIRDENGSVWRELDAAGNAGLNVVEYDLSADPARADAAERVAVREGPREARTARRPPSPPLLRARMTRTRGRRRTRRRSPTRSRPTRSEAGHRPGAGRGCWPIRFAGRASATCLRGSTRSRSRRRALVEKTTLTVKPPRRRRTTRSRPSARRGRDRRGLPDVAGSGPVQDTRGRPACRPRRRAYEARPRPACARPRSRPGDRSRPRRSVAHRGTPCRASGVAPALRAVAVDHGQQRVVLRDRHPAAYVPRSPRPARCQFASSSFTTSCHLRRHPHGRREVLRAVAVEVPGGRGSRVRRHRLSEHAAEGVPRFPRLRLPGRPMPGVAGLPRPRRGASRSHGRSAGAGGLPHVARRAVRVGPIAQESKRGA